MKFNKYFKHFTLFLIFLTVAAINSTAQVQNFPAPRENKLLNGTKLLVWSDPKADKVTVKLRVHSGSAFDALGKEGTMQLLSDILFPNDSIREFFADDLGGNLEIVTKYDYIQITASGNSDKFLTILETLATAVTNPQINKENTAKVRDALLAKVQKLETDPFYVADQAVAKRLLGNFPYGRPQLGSSESLQKIDFADILLADQKFLTADNATIAISGNVNADFALRATKRLFGGWLKADKKVPPTFAQPEAPKPDLQIIDATTDKTSELRLAIRGLARNDKDFSASQFLSEILQERVRLREGNNSSVLQYSKVLPGFLVFRFSQWNVGTVKKVGNQIALPEGIKSYQTNFLKDPITTAEFEKAKSKLNSKISEINPVDYWLDAETYKLVSVKDDWQQFQNVAIADVQRVLEKFQKESVALVLVVSSEKTSDNSATTDK